MKILYFSCHEILEYDEIRLLSLAGHTVFPVGCFSDPDAGTAFRKLPSDLYQPDLWDLFQKTGCCRHEMRVTKEFSKNFDVAIIVHQAGWVRQNLADLGDMPVVIRAIGQSGLHVESEYMTFGDRVKIVRYTDLESGIQGFAKTDAVIYFGKFADDFQPWVGGGNGITFHNSYAARDEQTYPKLVEWKKFHEMTASELWGNDNDSIYECSGKSSSEKMATLFQEASFYFYVCSHPPSYTLSLMEAMMSGLPIIAPSRRYLDENSLVDPTCLWSPARYEAPDFLVGGAGVVYDSIEEAAYYALRLQRDKDSAKIMSGLARKRALDLFDSRIIAQKWDNFFHNII